MLLHLSRVSFWLAALAAAWALIAPGRYETALTVVAGAGALLALALWRSALSASRRSFGGDADVPPPAMLTDASLVDAAAAIARIAEASTSQEVALRAIAAVLKTELGARVARIHDVLEVDATQARLAEWLPGPAPRQNGAGLRASARRVALAGSVLGAAIATQREAIELPRAIVVPFGEPVTNGAPRLTLIELETLDVAIAAPALASLLELTRLSHRALTRRLAAAPGPGSGDAAAATVAAAPLGGPQADKRIRVLVVEDKVAQSETTVRMLERLGCRVTVASGMLEAMHALGATQFELVLMDTHMPDSAAADRAMMELGGLRGTPTILALAEQADAGRLRELGFDDCLFKPFHRQQLQAMLDKHVRKRSPLSDNGDGAGGAPLAAGVLDPAALARLRELDPDGENQLVERVLKAFQTSAARLAPQLQAARDASDRNTVRLVAHTLKSSSASIGAMRLSQLCAELEATIRTDDSADIEPAIAAMTAALDAALQAIRQQLDSAR